VIVGGVPRAILDLGVDDVVKLHAAPLAARREALRALPRELKREGLFTATGMAQCMRAYLAIKPIIHTGDLLLIKDRLAEDLVSCTCHIARPFDEGTGSDTKASLDNDLIVSK